MTSNATNPAPAAAAPARASRVAMSSRSILGAKSETTTTRCATMAAEIEPGRPSVGAAVGFGAAIGFGATGVGATGVCLTAGCLFTLLCARLDSGRTVWTVAAVEDCWPWQQEKP